MIDEASVHEIMHEWAISVSKTKPLFYKISKGVIHAFSATSSRYIGRGGELMRKYEKLLREAGVKRVIIINVVNANLASEGEIL